MTNHTNYPDDNTYKKAAWETESHQHGKPRRRMVVRLNNQERNANNQHHYHASKPEGVAEKVSEGLGSPLRRKPVIAVSNVESATRHEP